LTATQGVKETWYFLLQDASNIPLQKVGKFLTDYMQRRTRKR